MAEAAKPDEPKIGFDASKLTPYQVPIEQSTTLDASQILDYDIREYSGIPHFFAVYNTVKPIGEKISEKAKEYFPSLKPTDDQLRFSKLIKKEPGNSTKLGYTKGLGVDYDQVIAAYNEIVKDSRIGVEDAYRLALGSASEKEDPDNAVVSGSPAIARPNRSRKRHAMPVAKVYLEKGSDLRDVASYYYGSESAWRKLAGYNGLKSCRIHAETELELPPEDYFAKDAYRKTAAHADKSGKPQNHPPISRVVIGRGADLRNVAEKHLGNANLWGALVQYNRLGAGKSVVPDDVEILIPPRSFLEQRDWTAAQ